MPPTPVYLLAGETGGTRTRVILLEVGPAGETDCVAAGTASGANPNTVGRVAARDAWDEAFAPICSYAAAGGIVISTSTLSCSGDGDQAAAAHAHAFTHPAALITDLLAPLHAVTADLTGTVLVAGTGVKAVSYAAGEPQRQAGGWGWWLGGQGSGTWIGKKILAAGLSDLDHGRSTDLLSAIAAVLDITGPLTHKDVLDHVYSRLDLVPGSTGKLAHLVDAVDDPRVARIRVKAARHLARLLRAVHQGGPVVLVGTVASGPIGRDAARRAGVVAVHEPDGLTGAAVHAARTAGLDVTPTLTAALRSARVS